MKVDDETLDYVKNYLGLSVGEYAKVDKVVAELMALRKVAAAASSMLQMAYANGEERAKWERLMGALVEAGY